MEVHPTFLRFKQKLGLSEIEDEGILIGRSAFGMTEPIQLTAISLARITIRHIFNDENLDYVLQIKLIRELLEGILQKAEKSEAL